jgi:hypothetical protein
MLDPVRSVFSLNMSVVQLFFLLVLFHEHVQPAWSQGNVISIALPLAVRSPYLSCWLPQINGTAANATSNDAPSTTTSDLSKVCPFF